MQRSIIQTTMQPLQGEIWEVDLEPVQGKEIQKSRPCVVISNDTMNTKLGLSIVVPITGTPRFLQSGKLSPTMVEIRISEGGVTKTSYSAAFQVRTVSHHRFKKRFGKLAPPTILAVVQSVQKLIDF